MNPVSVSDIIARWKDLDSRQSANAQAFIEDAWVELVRRVPDFLLRVGSGDIDSALLRKVICDAVIPVLRNPEGLVEESIDDYRKRRGENSAIAQIRFTDDALALLAPDENDSQAFSIAPSWDC